MADTLTVQDLHKELKLVTRKEEMHSIAQQINLSLTSPLDAHAKKITKQEGTYNYVHAVSGPVIQKFEPKFTEKGETIFKRKPINAEKLKVNRLINPEEVHASYLSAMAEEGMKAKDKSISKFVIAETLLQVKSDVSRTLIVGDKTNNPTSKDYLHTFDGINTIIPKYLGHADHPMFKVPVGAIGPNSILDNMDLFERRLPRSLRGQITKIFVSEDLYWDYIDAYVDKYNKNSLVDQNTVTTKQGRKIIPIPEMSQDWIFATVDRNLVKMVDLVENPAKIREFQPFDYSLKMFMEFTIGYDFLVNPLVFVGHMEDNAYGLGDSNLDNMYFKQQFSIV